MNTVCAVFMVYSVIMSSRTLRQCLKTTMIKGVTIPKGARVHIPIHLLHRLPEYWPDPEKFNPERSVIFSIVHSAFIHVHVRLTSITG